VDRSRRFLISAAPALAAWPAVAGSPALRDQLLPLAAGYESATGGRIGLYAKNLRTGRELAWRANERFVMCSTFKASLAALALRRVDVGKDKLDVMISYTDADILDYAPVARVNLARGALSIEEMCAGAVEYSDNTCANLLLAHVGGPTALTSFWRSISDQVTRLDHNEPELNRSAPGDPHDTTSPAAMTTNLTRLVLGDVLSLASRQRLTNWMLACKTGDHRLRGGLPRNWLIADKTGNNGNDAAGDIAVVWPRPHEPVVICVYTQGGSPTPDRLTAVFADVGRLTARSLG
jgi:beta-lactamase class A